MAQDEGTVFYVGDTSYNTMYVGDSLVIFNPILTGYVSYSFREDPYSASLLLAFPGDAAYATYASLPYPWSDVSADIRASGTNKSVTAESIGLYQSSSIAYFSSYSGSTFSSGSIVSTGSLYSPYTTVNSGETIGTSSITIEGWVAVPTTQPNRTLFSRYVPTVAVSSELRLRLSNPGFGLGLLNVLFDSGVSEGSYNSSNFTVNSGSFYHFALTKESNTIRLYWSGSKVGEVTDARIGNMNASPTTFTRVFGEQTLGDSTSTNLHFQDFRYYKGVAKYTGASYTPPDSMIIQTLT